MPVTSRLVRRQAELNAESRARWTEHEAHRRRVTDLAAHILPRPGQRLCVLGAGNANDLDLSRLLEIFAEIHLVDLDGAALAAGLANQGMTDKTAIHCHGGVDLSGCLDLLDDWQEDTSADSLVARLAGAAPPLPPGPFDLVLSTCLLTQMIEPVTEALGPEHPRLPDALKALRRRHLEIMLDLLAPGGAALLISDLVSSDTVPGLADTPEGELKALTTKLIEQRNFFSGANPFALLAELRDDPVLHRMVDQVAMTEPWLWRFSPARCFLVYAIALHRAPN